MPTEAGTELGRAFFEAQDRLQGGPDPELCAQDYIARLGGNPPMSLTDHQAFAQAFYRGFPDLRHTIEETIASGDTVAVRFTLRGTQRGEFMGIPPTGKPIEVGAIAILRTASGKVSEVRGQFDSWG
jgi:predicted ester cyclase